MLQVSVKEAERYLTEQQAQRAELAQQLKALKERPNSSPQTETETKLFQTQLSLW